MIDCIKKHIEIQQFDDNLKASKNAITLTRFDHDYYKDIELTSNR